MKIFLVASVDERDRASLQAVHIARELKQTFETLKEEIAARDYKDSHRGPHLKQAGVMLSTLDTTGLNIQEVVENQSRSEKNVKCRKPIDWISVFLNLSKY